jgi:hypothetical protein
VWLCCYRLRKKTREPFDAEHLIFIGEIIIDEIASMLANGFFEGVVYPCNYQFFIDDVVDAGNDVLLYVLFMEDEKDAAYINARSAVRHDAQDAQGGMEDDDFGRG